MPFLDTIKSLSAGRQVMLAAAVIGVVVTMVFMFQGVTKDKMVLLYSGLDAAHAGEVIDEIEQLGGTYDVRGNSIFIAEGDRDSVRFALAREGLPRQSIQGYELLDGVNGFSVTSEMYNATYWRAKEGELTRTILAIPGVESARVHIGASLRSGFSRSQQSHTASVTVSTRYDLTPSQAEAIQYLVALAVTGVDPLDVAVIDAESGVVAGPGATRGESAALVAQDQASALEQRILNLIAARVGAGNARVSVSVDVNRELQRTSSVVYDPESRVLRSRTLSEVSESSTGSGGGALTVASNLPQNTGGGGGGSNTMENSTESVAYEVNETRTEIERLPGEIERISIAVLLNEQALGIDLTAAGAAERAEQLATEFQQLIASAAGLNTERGDILTVEFMPFQIAPVEALVAAPSMMETLVERYFWSGVQALLLGLVVIILGLGVIRPMFVQGKRAEAESGPGAEAGEGEEASPETAQDPINYLQEYTRERQDDAAAILQDWLSENRKAVVNE